MAFLSYSKFYVEGLKTSACQFILFFKKPCIYKGFRTFPSCGISQFSRKVLAKIGVPTPPQFHTEGYRSGHNEAVLKTVWVYAHVGSNPTPSANKNKRHTVPLVFIAENFEMINPSNCEAIWQRVRQVSKRISRIMAHAAVQNPTQRGTPCLLFLLQRILRW